MGGMGGMGGRTEAIENHAAFIWSAPGAGRLPDEVIDVFGTIHGGFA